MQRGKKADRREGEKTISNNTKRFQTTSNNFKPTGLKGWKANRLTDEQAIGLEG